MNSIFDVDITRIKSLSPQSSIVFFADLLWAEARRIKIPFNSIDISFNINKPDGGIDAVVRQSGIEEDLIFNGSTFYQLKAGESFKPWQDGEIKKELFGRKKPQKENLGNAVKKCLDTNSTYVLVCLGHDLQHKELNQIEELIKSNFEEIGYPNSKAKVIDATKIVGYLRFFPSLSLQINSRTHYKFQSHASWLKNNSDMRQTFIPGEKQLLLLKNMRDEIRKTDSYHHIRLLGEPGIGKTKFILEVTKEDDLSASVIYLQSAKSFIDSELQNELLKEDNEFNAILVIDECNPTERALIWNRLERISNRVTLITIYNDYDDSSGNIVYFDMPRLTNEKISEIIQGYVNEKTIADDWAKECEGSPRVAHVIGHNLKENPEDLLKEPSNVRIWERYIESNDSQNSDDAKNKKRILQFIALFKRFGYEKPYKKETEVIIELIKKYDSSISFAEFSEIVNKLRKRKVLQGDVTLYITPKLLQIKLWVDWWEIYGNLFDYTEFRRLLQNNTNLINWFHEMFKYAASSPASQKVVKNLLSNNGPLYNTDVLESYEGGGFFLALTEADPRSALKFLKNTIAKWNEEKLKNYSDGRRSVINALELICFFESLFYDGAEILLKLALNENETYSNNSRGVFSDLFSLGRGRLAPTSMPPDKRLQFLEKKIDITRNENLLDLILDSLKKALQIEGIVRIVKHKYMGLQEIPDGWNPKTWGELFDAYRYAWRLLVKIIVTNKGEIKSKAIAILLSRARPLIRYENLSDTIFNTLIELKDKEEIEREELLKKVSEILHYESKNLRENIISELEKLKNELVGNDFSSLLRRYIGIELHEDRFNNEGKYEDLSQSKIDELAKECYQNQTLLTENIKWLLSEDAKKAYAFGYSIGKLDSDYSLWELLFKSQKKQSNTEQCNLLSGYLRNMFEKNKERWEKSIQKIYNSPISIFLPEILGKSGFTKSSIKLMNNLYIDNLIPSKSFKYLHSLAVEKSLRPDVFNESISLLIKNGNAESIYIALELCFYYYTESEYSLPKNLILSLIVNDNFFENSTERYFDTMITYYWKELAVKYINLFPDDNEIIAKKIINGLSNRNAITSGYLSESFEVIYKLTEMEPIVVWNLCKVHLDPPLSEIGFDLTHWMRGDEVGNIENPSLLSLIPLKVIWKWVDQDLENRAWLLAYMAPKKLCNSEEEICVGREILVRYGNREDVRRNFSANYWSGSWSGPESLHYENMKSSLEKYKVTENNQNVLKWIDEFIESLEKDIERARNEEERRGY